MEDNRKSLNQIIRKVLLTLLFTVLLIFLLIWLFPTKGYFSSLFQDVFRNNINSMRDAGERYFTNDRLPKEIGDSEKITLKEMLNKSLLLPFTDKNGNSCDINKSYVKVTKEKDEYKMKVYLSCDDEDAYIIVYLGCRDYCAGLGKCDQTCSSCGDNCANKKLYEFTREITKKVIKGYTCDEGYKKNGNLCYKTTTKQVTKDATPVYETTEDTKPATPKYSNKTTTINATPVYDNGEESINATPLYNKTTIKIDGTPVYGEDESTINATPHKVETQNYKYLYKKHVAKSYSNWSDWSSLKEYNPDSNNITWGKQDLVWNEKAGTKKITTTKIVYDKNKPIYEYNNTNVVGYYKRYVCSGYSYYMDSTTNTVYSYGEWTKVSRDTYTSFPSSSDPNVKYVYVGMNYDECEETCTLKPYYIVDKYVRTSSKAQSSTSGSGLSAVCNISYESIPVYGPKKVFVGYESNRVTEVSYKYYYHTKTRTITEEEHTDYKWTKIYNDPTLVNQGYTYVRREVESTSSYTYYTCPSGYNLNGTKCSKKTSTIIGYTCPSGYNLNGKKCEREVKYVSGYTCPTDYKLSGTKCYKDTSKIIGYTCPSGYKLDGKKCEKTEKYISGYTCPSGYNLSDKTCYKKSGSKLIGYKCPADYSLKGKKCHKTETTTVSKGTTPIYGSQKTTEYKWSTSKTLKGWERTGRTKTDKVCE